MTFAFELMAHVLAKCFHKKCLVAHFQYKQKTKYMYDECRNCFIKVRIQLRYYALSMITIKWTDSCKSLICHMILDVFKWNE